MVLAYWRWRLIIFRLIFFLFLLHQLFLQILLHLLIWLHWNWIKFFHLSNLIIIRVNNLPVKIDYIFELVEYILVCLFHSALRPWSIVSRHWHIFFWVLLNKTRKYGWSHAIITLHQVVVRLSWPNEVWWKGLSVFIRCQRRNFWTHLQVLVLALRLRKVVNHTCTRVHRHAYSSLVFVECCCKRIWVCLLSFYHFMSDVVIRVLLLHLFTCRLLNNGRRVHYLKRCHLNLRGLDVLRDWG